VSEPERHYKGLEVKADDHLHGQLADLVQGLAKPGATVVDVGAGAGALAQRLHDLGYDVLAVDVDEKPFGAEVPFQRLDFNDRAAVDGFLRAHQGRFDVVLGIEVIEHVENPWQYLRDLRALAKPGGHVVVSTPNVTSAFSRVWFLVRGRHAQFDENDLAYGHINPVSEWELHTIARGVGLEVVEVRPGGHFGLWLPTAAPKVRLANLAAVLLAPVMRGLKHGYCLVAVLRRPLR